MTDMAQERTSGSMVISAIVAAATHAIIPLFWLFCSTLLVPRYFAMADLSMEDLRKTMPVLVGFSHFIARHYVAYLCCLVFFLIADGTVYCSLLSRSNGKSAHLWSFGVAIMEVVVSLLLYLPLRNVVATMDASML